MFGGNSKIRTANQAAAMETYRDLIQKARNLTLQRDRLQTSQVLIRGIARETKGSPAYRELVKELTQLSGVFYTEKAQSLHSMGESTVSTTPSEALEPFRQALREEDGNVTVLISLSRTHLVLGECDKAEAYIKTAQSLNPYSPEVILIQLQTLDCQKNFSGIEKILREKDKDIESIKPYLHSIHIKEAIRKNNLKKAKSLITAWELEATDYPEVYFWKWELSRLSGSGDRAAAVKYSNLCQNMTLRRRKSFIFDVHLCKGKEAADEWLRESGGQATTRTGNRSND